MYEVIDGKKVLTTPVSAEDLKNIHIGDIVYLNGDITTCRDVAHRRVVEYGRELPLMLRIKQFCMPVRLFVHWAMTNLKWYPLVLPPACVWKNLKRNL